MAEINFKRDCWYAGSCVGLAGYPEYPRCKTICPRYKEMSHLINTCGMPDAERYLKTLSPSSKDRDAYARLQEIKQNIVPFVERGYSLFISSPNIQSGKTSWALKILYKYFDEIWCNNGFRTRGYFIHVPKFLLNLKNFDYNKTPEFKAVDRVLQDANLVIWDDITSLKMSDYERGMIETYLSTRAMKGFANIYTGPQVRDIAEIVGTVITNRISRSETIVLLGN